PSCPRSARRGQRRVTYRSRRAVSVPASRRICNPPYRTFRPAPASQSQEVDVNRQRGHGRCSATGHGRLGRTDGAGWGGRGPSRTGVTVAGSRRQPAEGTRTMKRHGARTARGYGRFRWGGALAALTAAGGLLLSGCSSGDDSGRRATDSSYERGGDRTAPL